MRRRCPLSRHGSGRNGDGFDDHTHTCSRTRKRHTKSHQHQHHLSTRDLSHSEDDDDDDDDDDTGQLSEPQHEAPSVADSTHSDDERSVRLYD